MTMNVGICLIILSGFMLARFTFYKITKKLEVPTVALDECQTKKEYATDSLLIANFFFPLFVFLFFYFFIFFLFALKLKKKNTYIMLCTFCFCFLPKIG